MSADSAAVRCRGVRGATFIDEDTPEAILAGTRELLAAIAEANGIATEDVASAFFTSTADLRSAFPARAARDLGWTDVLLPGMVAAVVGNIVVLLAWFGVALVFPTGPNHDYSLGPILLLALGVASQLTLGALSLVPAGQLGGGRV
jgi:monofunctional chorismate mutase